MSLAMLNPNISYLERHSRDLDHATNMYNLNFVFDIKWNRDSVVSIVRRLQDTRSGVRIPILANMNLFTVYIPYLFDINK
jgi:hypothetical protein